MRGAGVIGVLADVAGFMAWAWEQVALALEDIGEEWS